MMLRNATEGSNFVHVERHQNHMATTFEFTVSCTRADRARAGSALIHAHAQVARLEAEFSEFVGPIHQLNQTPPFERVQLPQSTLELLERARALSSLTGGAFSCTAKSTDAGADVRWDRDTGVAWRLTSGTHVGFGAIGKGYALDHARACLEHEGFTDYLLNAGGSSVCLSGFRAPSRPWRWGLSWLKGEGVALGLEFLHETGCRIALGVSGLHEKGHHLIDPRSSGAPRPQNFEAALVAHPSATEADALSTALFVLGFESGLQAFHELKPALAVIERDGTPRWNGAFGRLWRMPVAAASVATAILPATARAQQEEAIDLGADPASARFAPHETSRHAAWALLPAAALVAVLIHLKKQKRASYEKNIREALLVRGGSGTSDTGRSG